VIFFWPWWRAIFAGFLRKWCVERGFLLVNLWWVAGRSWCVGWRFSAVENFPLFLVYFREAFPLWLLVRGEGAAQVNTAEADPLRG
jgi:hypothetical protein